MADKEIFAKFGEKISEKFGGLKTATKLLLSNKHNRIGKVDKNISPLYATIGSGSYTPMKRGDSTSNILAKMFNIMVRDEVDRKKKIKENIKFQKSLEKLKEIRNEDLIISLRMALQCDYDGEGPTKPKGRFKGLKGLSMIGLGAAGLLFSPDVMAAVGDLDETFDNLIKKLDGIGIDLKFPTEQIPTGQYVGKDEVPPELEPIFAKVGKEVGVDPALLKAVASVESQFKPKATSEKGAKGLMQLRPGTAATYGVPPEKIEDPEENIRGGAKYLKKLLDMYDNNLELALAAYNAGPGRVKEFGNQIPPFKETQEYIPKVLGAYRQQKQQTDTQSKGGGGKIMIGNGVTDEELKGIDPRLMDMIGESARKQGYNVMITSGKEERTSGTKQHPAGKAVDIQLIDPQTNQVLTNKGPKQFREYEKFAQVVKSVQEQKYPDLNLRWGGYFSNRGGRNVPMDLMHFDIMPTAMGGGSWESGLTPEMRKIYPSAESVGRTIPSQISTSTGFQKTSLINNKTLYNVNTTEVKALAISEESTNSAFMHRQFG